MWWCVVVVGPGAGVVEVVDAGKPATARYDKKS
jgi:hypothetical protein